jgi:hypothetical protein
MEFDSWQGLDLSSPRLSDQLWVTRSLLSSGVPRLFSLGVKWTGREADHSPSSAKVKNTWSCTYTFRYVFMARCLIKYRVFTIQCNKHSILLCMYEHVFDSEYKIRPNLGHVTERGERMTKGGNGKWGVQGRIGFFPYAPSCRRLPLPPLPRPVNPPPPLVLVVVNETGRYFSASLPLRNWLP